MTQREFAQGWKLLILQPWGWRYRSMTDGKPSEESRTQLEFYYKKLSFGHPQAWMKVAELYAEGEEWPSVAALREALQELSRRYVQALTDQTTPTHGVSMPEDLRVKLQQDGILKSMPNA